MTSIDSTLTPDTFSLPGTSRSGALTIVSRGALPLRGLPVVLARSRALSVPGSAVHTALTQEIKRARREMREAEAAEQYQRAEDCAYRLRTLLGVWQLARKASRPAGRMG